MSPLFQHVVAAVLAAAPVAEREAPRVDRLIEQLGSDSFEEREAAERQLLALGETVLPALRKAASTHGDAEVRARAERIVRAICDQLYGEERRIGGHRSAVNFASFSPDGRTILSASDDHS